MTSCPGSSRFSAHFMTQMAEPNNTLWSTTDPVSLFGPGDCVHRNRAGHEDVSVRCLLDLRRTQLRVGPPRLLGERDLTSTVAIERYTASRNDRPPPQTGLRVTQCIGARTDSGGRYTATPTPTPTGSPMLSF